MNGLDVPGDQIVLITLPSGQGHVAGSSAAGPIQPQRNVAQGLPFARWTRTPAEAGSSPRRGCRRAPGLR